MPDGSTVGPEQGQPLQPNSPEQASRVNPRRLDPEKAARLQELLASLNRPGENASLAERRSFEMAQRAILENFGIPPIAGGSGEEPDGSEGQPPTEGQPAGVDAQTPEAGANSAGDGGGQEPPTPPTTSSGNPSEENNGNRERGGIGEDITGIRTISRDDISNPQILSELDAVNSLIEKTGDVDYEFLKSTQHRLARLIGDDIPGLERNTAISRITVLISNKELEAHNLSQEERSREAAREITGQTGYNIEQVLTDSKKRDEVFNDLFAGVDATPHEFFERAFNPLTYGMRFERFMDVIRNGSIGKVVVTADGRPLSKEDQLRIQEDLRKDFDRYQTERRVRQSLHDANAILYLPSIKADQLYDSMQQFSSDLGTFAWKMTGVKQMMDIYEAALREDMVQNGGYLRPEAVVGTVTRSGAEEGKEAVVAVKRGAVEEKTKERFRQMMKARLIARKNEQGQYEAIPEFKDWEIDRIFTISRGMMIMSERLLSLAAEGKLPKGMAQFSSLFLQDVIQSYAPYIHLLGKYGVTAESLAAYLYKEGEGQRLLGDLRRWNPHELREIVKKFTQGGAEAVEEILYSDEAMRYLMRPNPNRAGDIFTWVSWRVVPEPETVSMIQDFLNSGWNQRYPKAPDGLEYRRFITSFKPTEEEQAEKDNTKSEKDKKKIDKRMKARMASEWRRLHPDAPSIDDYEAYRQERVNWIGTAIRLEKLRGDLSGVSEKRADEIIREHNRIEELELKDKTGEKLSSADKQLLKEARAFKKAKTIIEQMVKFQPHRLYLVSPDIRERTQAFQKLLSEFGNLTPPDKNLANLSGDEIEGYLNKMFAQKDVDGNIKKNNREEPIIDEQGRKNKDRLKKFIEGLRRDRMQLPKLEIDRDIQSVLNDLSLVETAILGDREQLLSDGKTFDSLDLSNSYFDKYFTNALVDPDASGNVVSSADRRARAKLFARILRADYDGNTDKYYDEFIYKREYKHGFVLWTGDAPIDEYNANAVGPTAGFARRARDNKNQGEAFTEEIKMLTSLREMKTPDQAIKALTPVFDKISIYDTSKARQAIAEKAKGLAYFFGADTLTNVPIFGQLLEQSGMASVAQMVYGKSSGVWHAAETRYFFNELKNRGMLTQADYDKIAKEGFATKLDVGMDIGSAAAQLLVIALILYMLQRGVKEK